MTVDHDRWSMMMLGPAVYGCDPAMVIMCFLPVLFPWKGPGWRRPCMALRRSAMQVPRFVEGEYWSDTRRAVWHFMVEMLRSKLPEIQFEVAARPTKSQRSHITHGIKCRRIDSTRDYDRLKANVGKCMEAPQRMALQNCRSWVSHAEVSPISHVHKAWSLAPKQVPTWSNQFD